MGRFFLPFLLPCVLSFFLALRCSLPASTCSSHPPPPPPPPPLFGTHLLCAERRIREENLKREKFKRLQEEAINSTRWNAAVQMQWASLMETNRPQDLLKQINEQKAACGKM